MFNIRSRTPPFVRKLQQPIGGIGASLRHKGERDDAFATVVALSKRVNASKCLNHLRCGYVAHQLNSQSLLGSKIPRQDNAADVPGLLSIAATLVKCRGRLKSADASRRNKVRLQIPLLITCLPL
jgi:hypothetical protein